MPDPATRLILVSSLVFCASLVEARFVHGQGVVVEEVAPGSAGEKAGVLTGDVLLAWERPANPPANPAKAEGTIASPFDWMWVEMEQGPRGVVKVRGERDGKEAIFEVPIGSWGLRVRPRFDATALESYLKGKSAADTQQLQEGTALWEALASSVLAAGNETLALWITLRIGNTWAGAGRWKEADAAYSSAQERAERTANDVATGFIWDAVGLAFERQSRFNDAERLYRSALTLRNCAALESLSCGSTLLRLGAAAWSRADPVTAEEFFSRAFVLYQKLAPDGLPLARAFHNLGLVALRRDELTTAAAHFERAVAIQETLSPDSSDLGASLNNLGMVAFRRGALEAAASYLGRSLAIQNRVAPNSLAFAASLNNLGLVALERGDLAMAESYTLRAVAIKERLAPGSLDVARSLNNLGNIATNRGEFSAAQSYLTKAIAIQETLAPDSLDLARSLSNLGRVAVELGDLVTAETLYQRATSVRERLAPNSVDAANSLNRLGVLARTRGDLPMAETYYNRALAIQERIIPDSLAMAVSLNNLAHIANDRGDLVAAEGLTKRALAVREKLAPGSSYEAESLHDLALVYRKAGQHRLAANYLRRTIDALELQFGKVGGSEEAQFGFNARFGDYYRAYVDVLVEQRQPEEAFHVLERSRARTLLAMLTERDLVFTADLPADIERERKRIAWEFDQTQARLGRLNPGMDQEEVDSLLNQLRELRSRQSAVAERIRQQSPRLASLQYPQPMDVKAVQSTLDPGTLLLSYSVQKDKAYLFEVMSGAGITVHTLSIGEAELREEVEGFRRSIQRLLLGGTESTAALQHGRHLYDALLRPAATAIERAQRVLIIPDGPLHALPFAALVRDVGGRAARDRRDWQYLVEWKPVHAVVSATVYAELRKARENRGSDEGTKTLIAFGDPKYPLAGGDGEDAALDRRDAVVRSMLTRGYRLTPLPASRTEVSAIAELFRPDSDIYLDERATEERAKEVAGGTRYLHFASHGLLDERFPLNSGLALTIPDAMVEGQDNGILQAWEIFERVRIDADLVVLSACETGLGKEMGGEGLIGLTRAFQYAGARSVLASLWSVADETTAELMKQFYRYLKAGRSKDAALRQAQLDLIRGAVAVKDPDGRATRIDTSHPFYWAAFQLNGDWR